MISFMEEYKKQGAPSTHNIEHNRKGDPIPDTVIVENFQAPQDMMLGKSRVVEGEWIMGTKINSIDTWEAVKSGTLRGYSIEGIGRTAPIAV